MATAWTREATIQPREAMAQQCRRGPVGLHCACIINSRVLVALCAVLIRKTLHWQSIHSSWGSNRHLVPVPNEQSIHSAISHCDVMLKFMITGCTLTLTDSGSSLTFDAQRDHQVAASNVYTFKRVKYEITTFSLTELTVIFFLWLRVREIYAHEIDYQRKRVSCVCVCVREIGEVEM